MYFFYRHSLIISTQFSFRSPVSVNDILLHMSTSWHQPLDRSCDTFIVTLDIARAFDRV